MTENQNRLAAQVLIVDDEPDHADVMADALRKPGHVSTIVNTVEAALDELLYQRSPDGTNLWTITKNLGG